MKRILCGMLALGVAVLALSFTPVRADEKEKPKTEDKPKTEAVQAEGALTNDQLKERLEAMGYEFKEAKGSDGTPMYLVTMTADNYNYVFYVYLSPDKSKLWINSPLLKLPESDKVRTDILEKILAKNNETAPIFFTLRPDRYLSLQRGMANQGLTAKRLRQEITSFMSVQRSTEELWNPAKYPPVATKVIESK